MAEPTGGMSSISGESLLVTPSGQAVGSAERFGSGGGIVGETVEQRRLRNQAERDRRAETQRLAREREEAEAERVRIKQQEAEQRRQEFLNQKQTEIKEPERKKEFTVFSPGTVIASEKRKVKGTDTPFVEFTTIGQDFASRPSTQEEKELFVGGGELQASTETQPNMARQFVLDTEKSFRNIGAKELISKDFIEDVSGFVGRRVGEGTRLLPGGVLIPKKTKEDIGEFTGGSIEGFIPTTTKEFAITGLSFGIGAGVGAGTKGLSVLASRIPKIGGGLSKGLKGATFIGGGVLTSTAIAGTVPELIMAEGPKSKGEVFGATAREFTAFGFGFKGGEKGVLKLQGLLATRGRTEIPIERLVPEDVLFGAKNFPEAPKSKQLQLFKDTAIKFPELTETGGGFHASAFPIEVKGKITPGVGASEVPGLFVSSYISPHFTRITGKGSSSKIPRIEDIFSLEGRPGVAFIEPEGFRVVKTKQVKPFELDGQTFRREFIKEVKPGVGDLPLLKTEIEAVFRPGVGEFAKVDSKFFTEIKGIKVPIDQFKFIEGTGKAPKLKPGERIVSPKEVFRISAPRTSSTRGGFKLPSSSRGGRSSSILSSLSGLSSGLSSSLSSPKSSTLSRTSKLSSSFLSRGSSLSSQMSSALSSFSSGLGRSSVFSSSLIPKSRRTPPGPPRLDLFFPKSGQDLFATRKFFRNPSFGGLQLGSIGIKLPKVGVGIEMSGLGERVGSFSLPKSQDLLGEVVVVKRNKKGKIKRKKK